MRRLESKACHKPDLHIDITEESLSTSNVCGDDDVFVKGDVCINSAGVAMRNNPKTFRLYYDQLEIGEMLGRGASSVVLHGYHRPTGTYLALKVINLLDKNKRDQLIREICSLFDADCPSIITFFGAFYREGTITIALEYMDGGSLANVLAQIGAIPEHVLAAMSFQILWGLAYLKHDKRVHRDIKPSNILINSKGELKITDFGVAAELVSSIAMCGTFLGTWKYMSPERIRNQSYGYSSDIWSYGLVMMECATGQYPFREFANCIEMAQMILDSDVPELPTSFSFEFRDFLRSCLHRDPLKRVPADLLLSAPWLNKHKALSYESSVKIVRNWIRSL